MATTDIFTSPAEIYMAAAVTAADDDDDWK